MSTNISLKNSTDTTLTIKHSDGSKAKIIDSKDIAVAVSTIADFPANPNDGDVVIVRDTGVTYIYNESTLSWVLSPALQDLQDNIDLKADLDSPTFTGTPTVPTASTGDSSTKIATTQFVKNEPIEYAQIPVGSVIQVIQALKNDCFYTASSSWVDWTGMSVTITPTRSNSKFLVSMTSGTGNDTNNSFAYVKLQRNGADIALGDARGGSTRCWVDASRQTDPGYPYTAKHISGEYLDNPEPGSTIVYKLQVIRTYGGTQVFGGSFTTGDANRSSIPSTLTVKEIAQ